MSLGDALDTGLLVVEFDNTVDVGEPVIVTRTYAFLAVVDQRGKKMLSGERQKKIPSLGKVDQLFMNTHCYDNGMDTTNNGKFQNHLAATFSCHSLFLVFILCRVYSISFCASHSWSVAVSSAHKISDHEKKKIHATSLQDFILILPIMWHFSSEAASKNFFPRDVFVAMYFVCTEYVERTLHRWHSPRRFVRICWTERLLLTTTTSTTKTSSSETRYAGASSRPPSCRIPHLWTLTPKTRWSSNRFVFWPTFHLFFNTCAQGASCMKLLLSSVRLTLTAKIAIFAKMTCSLNDFKTTLEDKTHIGCVWSYLFPLML